ncbi:HAD family phosphatase [Candidatus Babeliales bacterium]|nr:HAD family phosphatase [Candidatus Babeliales bacterium]
MHLIKQHIKAVIFDMDGTIIQTEPLWDRITSDTLRLCNIYVEKLTDRDKSYLNSLSGAGFREALQMLKQYFKLSISLDEFVHQTKEISSQTFNAPIQFINGFENFHTLLQEHKVPSGIATNAHRENLDFLSEKLNFNKFFGKHLYASSDVGNRAKPDPALFLHTAKQLGVQPHECVVFEDSPYGFKAAQDAGMPCVAIAHSRNSKYRHMAHGVIHSYDEAMNILHDICNNKITTINQK